MAINVVVAHPEILYKQALSNALALFEDVNVVNQARYYEELINIIKKELPDFVVASVDLFGNNQRIIETASMFPEVNFIILTRRSEEAISKLRENVHGFLTFGYLIDLYRLMQFTLENKKFAQPAVIKDVLSHIKRLEESGISTETLLFDLDRRKLSIIVDIILGKSFEEICYHHKLSAEELNEQIEKILEVIKRLLS